MVGGEQQRARSDGENSFRTSDATQLRTSVLRDKGSRRVAVGRAVPHRLMAGAAPAAPSGRWVGGRGRGADHTMHFRGAAGGLLGDHAASGKGPVGVGAIPRPKALNTRLEAGRLSPSGDASLLGRVALGEPPAVRRGDIGLGSIADTAARPAVRPDAGIGAGKDGQPRWQPTERC